MKTALVWLRHDLRLTDHNAIHQATTWADKVYLTFVFDPTILEPLPKNDKRVSFIWDSLENLKRELGPKANAFKIFHGLPSQVIPKIAKDFEVQRVYATEDYEPRAINRDSGVQEKLIELGVDLILVKDSVIFHKDEVVKKDGSYYKVFTPYKKQWLELLSQLPLPKYKTNLEKFASWPDKPTVKRQLTDLQQLGFHHTPCLIKPGIDGAKIQWENFRKIIQNYHEKRDFPSLNATSGLSVHLRFGTISIRQLVSSCSLRDKGHEVWLSELIWREFYKMILFYAPYVETQAFRKEFQDIQWRGQETWFQKWKEGQTGFPIVDATMRHFANTGMMHNRLRMVVAQFLTKDLLVDWRKGEEYFALNLLDFDLSANNGGWQWSSSTGCDAQPYFRIFNPWLQSKKFDKEGEFIKKHLPELAPLEPKFLHDPASMQKHRPKSYPAPIVDHSQMRDKALAMFKATKSSQ